VSKTRIVAVKLTPTEHEALAQLVANGYYETASAGLRAGLMLLLDHHKLKRDARDQIRMERIRHPQRKRARTGQEEEE